MPIKKTILLTFVLLFIILAFSCKKDDSPTPANISGTPKPTTVPGATFNALCSNQKIYRIVSGTTYSATNAQNSAVFTGTVINNFVTPSAPFLNAGFVSLNNKVFKNTSFLYTDSTNTYFSEPFVWAVSGSSVSAFTYTNSNPYTVYADYVYWPDTINRSMNFSVSFMSAHNADELLLTISKSGTGVVSTYTALTSSGFVTVNGANLSSLSTFTTADIQCDFYKNNVVNIGGLQVNFRNVTTFIKTVPVK